MLDLALADGHLAHGKQLSSLPSPPHREADTDEGDGCDDENKSDAAEKAPVCTQECGVIIR